VLLRLIHLISLVDDEIE